MSIVDQFDHVPGFDAPEFELRAGDLAAAGRPWVLERLREVDAGAAVLAARRVRLLGRLGEEALMQAELDVELDPSQSPARRQELQWRSLAVEVAASLHLSTEAAARQLGEAWTLTQKCEQTLQALEAGEIGFGHAQAIAREVAELDVLRAGAAQDALLPYAKRLSPCLFARKAREVLDAADPERLADRHRRAFANRHVAVDAARDGMAALTAFVDAGDAALIRTGLSNAARETKQAGDERTHRQVEADLFVEILMNGQVISGAPAQPGDGDGDDTHPVRSLADLAPVTVELLVPAATAAGGDGAPGKIPGVGMIDSVKARELICRAPSLRRILVDPITSAIVDFDRRSYRVPAELKRMIRLRDEHCRAPGCPRPPRELDHTVDYARGGTTSRANLAGLCSNHHHVKHETGWGLAQHADGILDWISPAGRHHLTRPDVIMPAEPPPDPWADTGESTEPAPFDRPPKAEASREPEG